MEEKNTVRPPPLLRRGKSTLHRDMQHFLKNAYGGKYLFLEKKFPSINRTADVVLMEEKRVIEIQTSLIGIGQMLQRTEDYKSIGFEVVWLLHDRVFLLKPPPLVTRFFSSQKAYFFSFHNEKLFTFFNLDLEPCPHSKLFAKNLFLKRWISCYFWALNRWE